MGSRHRRGGYGDPESQTFIESWFGQFKKRCAWRAEWETIDQARAEIAASIETPHHRPHSGLGYRTPREVAATQIYKPERPEPTTRTGSTSTAMAIAIAANPSDARSAAEQNWSPFVLVAGLLLIGLVADDDGLFASAGHQLARTRDCQELCVTGVI